MSLPSGLADEARRQFTICNACRYCEGFCPVFAALERDGDWSDERVEHLAHLCHDCRGCYFACMYSPPHEFALNLPKLMQEVRLASYGRPTAVAIGPAPTSRADGDASPGRAPVSTGRGALRVGAVFLLVAGVICVLSLATEGAGALSRHGSGSPYRTIAYPALVALAAATSAWAIAQVAWRSARRWRRTRTVAATGRVLPALRAALADAAALRQLHGGGPGCYATERPSGARKHAHLLLSYGVLACLVSTIAAAIEQDLVGRPPPYPVWSVPVVAGLAGGIAIVLGCAGLAFVRWRAEPAPVSAAMAVRDYGLLSALAFVAATGIATLVVRHTTGYPVVLVVHLAAVVTLIALVPYSKLMHAAYRFVALVVDRAELEAARAPS